MLTKTTQLSDLNADRIDSWSANSLVWGPGTVTSLAVQTWKTFELNKPIVYDGSWAEYGIK